MERRRFDQLTRLVATGRSRREVLKLFLGGVAAGVFGTAIRPAVQAQVLCNPACQGGQVCNALGECAATCGVENAECTDQADCCLGFGCIGISETGSCTSICLEQDVACAAGGVECCGALECTDLGQGPVCFECIPEGDPCETVGCCEGLVCNEFMTACVPACAGSGDECGDGGTDCCDGLQCSVAGFCEPFCAVLDDICGDGGADCCEGLQCNIAGFCESFCIPEGDPCETTGCCEGLVCNEFMTACVPVCLPEGEKCGKDDDCCNGLGCDAKGICVGVCAPGGSPCEMVAGSCCEPFTCLEAICDIPRGCVGKGLRCAKDFPCCDKELCVNGVCGDHHEGCGLGGDPCEMVAGSCCAPFTCFEAICDIPKGCVDVGLTCVADFPCCDGLTCRGSTCELPDPIDEISTLPETGAGYSAGETTSWITGAALAGGAAALAAKWLKDEPATE